MGNKTSPYPGVYPAMDRRAEGPEYIEEPSLLDKAQELMKHVSALDQEYGRLRQSLVGPSPREDMGNSAKDPSVPSIDLIVRRACERVASLVGDIATLNGRIG